MLACSSSPDIGSTSANSTQSNLEQQLVAAWTDPTYTTDGAPFQTITLNQDGSFQWSAPCVSQGVATCQSIRTDSGTWTVALSGPQLGAPQGATQLKLVDQFNQETDYFVRSSSGTMTLNTQITLGSSYTFDMGSSSPSQALQAELVGPWNDPTYTSDGAPFQGITLNQDGSFQWTAPCVSQGVESCHSVRTDSGNWSVALSGPQLGAPQGATQLKLVDQFNQETDYFVQLSSGNMVLNTAITLGSSYTFTMGSNIQPAPSGDGDGGTGDSGSVGEGGSGSDDGGSGDDGGSADSSSGEDGGAG
jgi:hypothetical protein